ncbi:sensor histidine kinase [Microbispora sp. NEAU-D428]|uniref:sensor histidine kinase n=1 Tax=Microbispora sitophila TaxID=2771537 RepID=UPI0018680D45|nr:ATP-binding protein [Microbispora sitophila]MBE3008857.1 sensor histidine kinase [Microbispora sitophila]
MLREPAHRWRPSRLDVLLALAVTISGLVESFGRQGTGPEQVDAPVPYAAGVVTAGLLLLLRRRIPVTALLALTLTEYTLRMVTGSAYYAAWHFHSTLILIHTVAGAAEPRSRRGLAGLGCVLVAYAHLQTLQGIDFAEVLIGAIFVGVAYGSGILLRRQTDQTRRLAAQAARLEAERELRARWAVAEERSRSARELHDIVSHNVSLMTLHVGGVRRLLGDDRARERGLLLAVEQAGREAVEELGHMLGMLRAAGTDAPEAPRTGLDRLDELVSQVADAGPVVRLRVTGERRPLPPGLDLSAYRVIQESLTNVLKHAHATKVDVVVHYAVDELRVAVVNDGPGARPAPDGGGGHGLIGMRERTAMHGGELTAGPTPSGGYEVRARFPLTVPAAGGSSCD